MLWQVGQPTLPTARFRITSVGANARSATLIALSLIVALGLVSSAYAQVWEFGARYSAPVGLPAKPLTMQMSRASLASAGFLANVGGVAFMQEAVPAAGLQNERVTLRYDPARPDGSRLLVDIGGRTVTAAIPDWQLIPVARYAGSDFNAVLSLFGEAGTAAMYEVQYHEAMHNTLLGLRMLQSDVLLMDLDMAITLPSWNGTVVRGSGEAPPDAGAAGAGVRVIDRILEGARFQSWVLTDADVRIQFGTKDDALVLTGEPYYHFWRFSPRSDALADSLAAAAARHDRNVDRYNAVVNRHNAARARQQQAALAAELSTIRRALDRDAELIKRLMEQFDQAVEVVEPLTSSLRDKAAALRRLNPAVYSAAENTMRYAALFRYVKRTQPQAYQDFLNAIRAIEPLPRIQTPTHFPKP